MTTRGTPPHRNPTQAEIAAECRRIQAEWSDAERWRRVADKSVPQEVEVRLAVFGEGIKEPMEEA